MNTRLAVPERIAFCITELEPGGAERCFVELITRLDRRRFEPTVYCLGPRPVGNPTSLADMLEQAGVPVHYFEAKHWWEFPQVLMKLRRRFAAEAPRIAQSFLFHANIVMALAARGADVPHVVSGIRVAERRRPWHLTLARWTDRWVERHVCVSASVRDFSHQQAGLPLNKLMVIPNGVDAERFAAARPCPLASLAMAADRRCIAFVGRLDEQKGLPWLLRLMPRVFAGLPRHDLVLIGAGPLRGELEAQASEQGLADRMHFAGFRNDVAEILAAADLLVLPSRWEGMPNVLLEAMAAGKPVVATRVEGVAELLGVGGTAAQTVPVDDSEGFTDKVVAILGDPLLAAELGAQNRQRAQAEFGFETMVEAYQRLYASLTTMSK